MLEPKGPPRARNGPHGYEHPNNLKVILALFFENGTKKMNFLLE